MKTNLGAALLGASGIAAASSETISLVTPRNNSPAPNVPLILKKDDPDLHRRRLENIRICEQSINKCRRKHLIRDYLPGQVVYNLGEYPSKERWAPNKYDEEELDRLRDGGIKLIQLHHEWNDWQRLFGGDTFTAINPEGLRRFISMVHQRGMKIILFCSTGWFERREPAFRPEWSRGHNLDAVYFKLAACSPASAGWRAYMLPRLMRILDDYEIDGLYNDLGYAPLHKNPHQATPDEVLAFEETATHDAALEDLLALIYAEVKRRGGIVKLHHGVVDCPNFVEKVYDYLWVGESVNDIDKLRLGAADLKPYAVPCLDMTEKPIMNEDELYLNSIPYMQFPLLMAGRIFTGERCTLPNIEYAPEESCVTRKHCLDIWRFYNQYPSGPYSYGWWDSVPGRPDARGKHAYWLKKYQPLVEEGTRAYIDITGSFLFPQGLPADVIASAFANKELYLVLANYGTQPATVTTSASYINDGDAPEQRKQGKEWTLAERSMVILRRA